MELDVKRVGLQSCFVALPQSVLEILLSSNRLPSLPVVIELNPVQNFGGSSSYYVGWDGAASSSPHIEVPEALAECIGLPTGARVRVRARGDVSTAETVVVEPATEDDWEILELNAEYLENHILSKVGVVIEGQNFPVWVTGKVVLTLRVISTSPKGILKLVPGVELVVAPKKRQLNKEMPPGSDLEADECLPEQTSVFPIEEAWLRVQEIPSSLMRTIDLAGITCSTTPTTSIFVSPNTAKEISVEDGQLIILSTGHGQNQDQMMGTKGEFHDRRTGVDGSSGKHAAVQYPEDDYVSELEDETHHRHAIVQLKCCEGVGAGHVMVAFPLRVFIGATIHMLVLLQPVSSKDIVQPKALVLSPVLFRPGEEVDSSIADKGDDMNTIGISRSLDHERDEGQSKDAVGKWQGHRYLLAAAAGFQKERSVQLGVHDERVSSLLLSWFDAQATVYGNTSDGVPIASEAIVHIQMSSITDEGLEARQASHMFTRSSNMPEIFLKTGDRIKGRARNFLFLLRAFSSGKGGFQQGRRQRNVHPPGYLLLREEILSLQSRSSEQLDKSNFGLSTLRQGIPRQLSCIVGMNTEVIDGPTLKSLPWLEEPASEVLARLEILLFHTSRNKLKLLGTPLPGSVLLHGPMACGKTQLALALARELQDDHRVLAHGVLVKCSELVGEQAMTIRGVLQDALQEAVHHAPSLIILDDLDVLLPAAGSEGSEPGVAVLSISEFLADLMDISQGRRNNEFPAAAIAFLAVATAPTALPSCLCASGRLDFYVELPAPAATERAAILAQVVMSHGLVCSESVAAKAAANCDGADTSDLELLVDRAVHAAASRFLTSEVEKLPSKAAATADTLMPQDQQKMLRSRTSLDDQQSLPLMQKKKFELVDEDFMAALNDFVPLAFRGIAKVGTPQERMGWEDVGGLYETRVSLQEMLEMPVKYSKLFAQAPLRLRTGVLLYGPPGCGKTHIVGAAAAACSLRLISVKGPELLNKYIGASEQGVRDVFTKATAAAPCILFFDEFDAIAPQRGHDNTGVTDRVVNQLLTELDGVEALNGVFVFAATSRPDLLDAALLRPGRLDRLLMCDFPSSRERYEILEVLSRKLPMEDDVDLDLVASLTEGFSGADLQAVLSDAQLESVHSFLEAGKETLHERKPMITMSQLRGTVTKARPSVPDSERKRLYGIYDAFMGAKTSLSSKRDIKGKRATLA